MWLQDRLEKTEIIDLQWSQVDLDNWIVCFNRGEPKNDQARTVCLDAELKAICTDQCENRKKSGKLTPLVFTNDTGSDSIKDLRGAWGSACTKAKIGKRASHDFRRTAVGNMVTIGNFRKVARSEN